MKRIFLFTALLILLTSCFKETLETANYYSDEKIIFGLNISGEVIPEIGSKTIADGSTALTLQFARADQDLSGVYGSYGAAFTATRAASLPSAETALVISGDTQYYLASGKKTKITGWYPNPDSYQNQTATWTMTGAEDIMTAAKLEGDKTDKAITKFTFNHKTSQLQFWPFCEDATVQAAWGKITKIEVLEQKNTCTYTLSAGETTGGVSFSGDATSIFTAYSNSTGTLAPITTAVQLGEAVMIAPQSASYVLKIQVTTEKGGIIITSVPAQAFQEGKAYKVSLKLTGNQIQPTASITEWPTASNIDVIL